MILPVASSVVIPLIPPFFVLPNALAPTMFPKKPTPGESTLNSRSMVALKSLALTAVPSEYLRPLRSVSEYVFDDAVLPDGATLLAELALRRLAAASPIP